MAIWNDPTGELQREQKKQLKIFLVPGFVTSAWVGKTLNGKIYFLVLFLHFLLFKFHGPPKHHIPLCDRFDLIM